MLALHKRLDSERHTTASLRRQASTLEARVAALRRKLQRRTSKSRSLGESEAPSGGTNHGAGSPTAAVAPHDPSQRDRPRPPQPRAENKDEHEGHAAAVHQQAPAGVGGDGPPQVGDATAGRGTPVVAPTAAMQSDGAEGTNGVARGDPGPSLRRRAATRGSTSSLRVRTRRTSMAASAASRQTKSNKAKPGWRF